MKTSSSSSSLFSSSSRRRRYDSNGDASPSSVRHSQQKVERFESRTIDRLMDMALSGRLEQLWGEHDKLGAYCGIALQLPLTPTEHMALADCRAWHERRSVPSHEQQELFARILRSFTPERPLMLSLGDALRLHAALATFEERSDRVVGLLRETLRIILRGICAARHFRRLDEEYGISEAPLNGA